MLDWEDYDALILNVRKSESQTEFQQKNLFVV